ncbi:MAG: hypothetical protein ACMUEL_01890 [Flavobacteriales bacterium Tduv]
MYFWQYKALIWLRKGFSERISSCVCPASYQTMAHNLYRSLNIIMRCS